MRTEKARQREEEREKEGVSGRTPRIHEVKGDNGQEGSREKTEDQWGEEEGRRSEGRNGLYQTPVRQVGSSELKRNYRHGGVKRTI